MEIVHLLVHYPASFTGPDLGRSWELKLGLLCRWQGSDCLDHPLLPPGVCTGGKLEGKRSHAWNLGTMSWAPLGPSHVTATPAC